MILPMLGFILMLIVFRAVASLVAGSDERAKKYAPFAYLIFFASVGALVSIFLLGSLGSLVSVRFGDSLGFVGGPIVGVLLGGFLGYYLGLKRKRKVFR